MRKFLKVLGLLVVAAAALVALAWWWYLRADPMTLPALPGAVQTGSLEHEGHERSWLAYIPAARAPHPALVLVMHGSMGTGAQMRDMTRYGFDVLAERHGFIAVYPDGYQQHWNDCRGSADYAAKLENIDDVGFLRALVRRLVDEHGVDPTRVFATGLSNGGQMAYRLGLEAPDLVAGIASMAASLPVPANLDCQPSGKPVAAMVMNGTADPVNPYAGGLVKIFGDASRGEVQSSIATAAYWAGLAGYTGEGEHREWPTPNPGDATSVQSIEWSDAGKVPVSMVTIVGGGHSIPHPVLNLSRILGPTSHQLDAPGVIWAFFSGAVAAPR
ncbi:MAG: dienelactone hydrolase family protein [Halioglobus sp.]|nr:dienelactone hydrolase family protein [Halioglobus sp.]MBP6724541.1 dienelactone hydrolase family protein [Halioglobus sp.]